MQEYDLNKYYVPADDDIFIESYKCQEIYDYNEFITNGIITVSKKYFPNLVCSKTSTELPDIASVRTFYTSLLTDEKCKEVIEKFNTLEKCPIEYEGKALYHSKKRQDVLVNTRYSEYLKMGWVLYDDKTQLIYVFDNQEGDEYAELPETYDLMFLILPFDKKSVYTKKHSKIIRNLEAYYNEGI